MAQRNLPVEVEDPAPAYLAKYADHLDNEEYGAPASTPFAVVSIRGSKFKARFGGEEGVLRDANGHAQPYFDIVLLKGALDENKDFVVSKTFYEKDFKDDSAAAPDCSAQDWRTGPDPQSPNPQSDSCRSCQWNKWNTSKRGKGKRCQDNRRFAVLPSDDLGNEKLGGAMLLRVPPGSFGNLDEYKADCQRRGRKIAAGVTRLSFDAEAEYPKLEFSWGGWLSEEEIEYVLSMRETDQVERILNISLSELGDHPVSEAIEEEPAEEAAPAPAAAPADRVAAARAAAKARGTAPAAAPAAAAPPPRRAAPAAAAPAARPAAPAARPAAPAKPAAPVTPARPAAPAKPAAIAAGKAPARVVPMRPAAPAAVSAEPVETEIEKRRRVAREALEAAKKAAADLQALEVAEVEGAPVEEAPFDEEGAEGAEGTEVAEDGEVVENDDFLDELDQQVGTIPD